VDLEGEKIGNEDSAFAISGLELVKATMVK